VKTQIPKVQILKKVEKERHEIILKAIAYAKIKHYIKLKDILAVDVERTLDIYYVEIYLRNSNLQIIVKLNEKTEYIESWIQPVRGWE